jgi:hypothetical protein
LLLAGGRGGCSLRCPAFKDFKDNIRSKKIIYKVTASYKYWFWLLLIYKKKTGARWKEKEQKISQTKQDISLVKNGTEKTQGKRQWRSNPLVTYSQMSPVQLYCQNFQTNVFSSFLWLTYCDNEIALVTLKSNLYETISTCSIYKSTFLKRVIRKCLDKFREICRLYFIGNFAVDEFLDNSKTLLLFRYLLFHTFQPTTCQ